MNKAFYIKAEYEMLVITKHAIIFTEWPQYTRNFSGSWGLSNKQERSGRCSYEAFILGSGEREKYKQDNIII